MARVLIAGCGYVGSALGDLLVGRGDVVWGLRRRVPGLSARIRAVEADLGIPSTLSELPRDLDYVVFAASPGGSEDLLYRRCYVEGLRNLLDALVERDQYPKRILLASSTAVYGQDAGEEVDETSATEPTHFSGVRLLEAERLLANGPFPATVVRFGGIYGPRRTRMIDGVRAGRAHYRAEPPQYTNRIHRDDCAGVFAHLMDREDAPPVVLGVDDEAAPERVVLEWIAGVLGTQAPRPAEDAVPEPARRGNKRCRNALLRATGYEFRYPTFREGYAKLIEDLR